MLLIAMLIASAAATEGQQEAVQPAPLATTAPVKPHKICRKSVPTGSMLAHSTCLTAEQWKARDAADGLQVERLRDMNVPSH